MSYSFVDIQKIKKEGQMTAKYNHNCRKIDIDNVIPELTKNNEDLIALPKENGKELSYYEAFKDRMKDLPYYQNRKWRSDAVLGFEVLLTYSRDDNVDVNKWKEQSAQWLKDTFNVAPDGKNNVLHTVFHADETGNVHCHAFVVPIDERGRLNACRWTNGSRAMSKIQSSYAKSVENLGLKRGIAGSSAKHRDIRRMYATLNNVSDIPKAHENETGEQYRERTLDALKTSYAKSMKEADDKYNEKIRKADEIVEQSREAIRLELEQNQLRINQQLDSLNTEKDKKKKEIGNYEDMIAELSKQLEDIKWEITFRNKDKDKISFHDEFEAGIDFLKEENPEYADTIQNDVEFVVNLGKEHKKDIDKIEQNIDL